jgi:hypothetical protein
MKNQIDKNIVAFIVESLAKMREDGPTKFRFDSVEQFEALKEFVKEGYLTKEDKIYSLTEKGSSYLKECEDKIEKAAKEDLKRKMEMFVEVSYKQMGEDGKMVTLTEAFELDATDRLPVIRVDESGYRGLLDRRPGQHWAKFLGEAGRKIVREKKLEKFYVENVKTGNRYLYIIPK